MGNSSTKYPTTYYISDEEEKSDEDDEFIPASRQEMQARMNEQGRVDSQHVTTDAAVNTYNNVHFPNKIVGYVSDSDLNLENVMEIEKQLDLNEKISLIYLLYDNENAELALQYALTLYGDSSLEVLREWVNSQKRTTNEWKVKLKEALAIIQNYYILCGMLGNDRKSIEERFLPYNESSSLLVDLLKKKLYRLAEDFDNATTREFLQIVKRDFEEKRLEFKDYGVQYLEMYFLHWTTIGYISPPRDLKNICKALKIMTRFDLADSLDDLTKKFINTRTSANTSLNSSFGYNIEDRSTNVNHLQIDLIRQCSMASESTGQLQSTSTGTLDISLQPERARRDSQVDNIYEINPKLPGVCLIINQENFYTEFDKKLKNLLPTTRDKLEERFGTQIDRNRLEKTFKKFGFKVIIEDNLTHSQIKETLIKVIDENLSHSSLVVCILSHGLEGKVYGVNSIPVDVQEIKYIMCKQNPKLRSQPKVLILQSCQGQQCQEVPKNVEEVVNEDVEEHDLATDGVPDPYTANMFVFWATVPGFGAIRDKKRGSWFIQSLCKNMEENAHNMHFEDICTMVHNEINKKRWETKSTFRVMVPIKESTFSKFFYLPRIQTEDS